MWLVGIGFTLLGLMIGYVMGGKEGVDSCGEVFYDNSVFRHSIEHIIKIKNNKKLKEKQLFTFLFFKFLVVLYFNYMFN